GQLRNRGSQSFGILFGGEYRNSQDLRSLNQRAAVREHPLEIEDLRNQFCLDVDDQQPTFGSRQKLGTTDVRRFLIGHGVYWNLGTESEGIVPRRLRVLRAATFMKRAPDEKRTADDADGRGFAI